MLTRKQYELLMFIQERLRQTGVSPSFDEMKEALNLRSKSGIHRLITGLAERGFIRRLAHRARALEVVRMPENAGTPAAPPPAAANATADNGAIVVALVDSNEVTLKRLRRKHGSIALEPANPVYETRIFGPDRVQVQGKLVGLLRRY